MQQVIPMIHRVRQRALLLDFAVQVILRGGARARLLVPVRRPEEDVAVAPWHHLGRESVGMY